MPIALFLAMWTSALFGMAANDAINHHQKHEDKPVVVKQVMLKQVMLKPIQIDHKAVRP